MEGGCEMDAVVAGASRRLLGGAVRKVRCSAGALARRAKGVCVRGGASRHNED